MVITELQNKQQVEAFLSALRGSTTSVVTQRPYAAHLLFLVTGLELAQATLLLELLSEIDVVSGPYLACHVFVDRIRTPTYVQLLGIHGPKAEVTDLTVRQAEGLVQGGSLNHVELADLGAKSLTSSTELVARALGLVGQVPCIAVMDAGEISSSGKMSILPFPSNREEMGALIRRLVGLIASGESVLRQCGEVLETIHDLFDQRMRLLKQRGAPTEHKLRLLAPLLKALPDDPEQVVRSLRRIRRVVGDCVVVSDREAKCLHQISPMEIERLRSGGLLSAESLQQGIQSLVSEFGIQTGRCMVTVEDMVAELPELRAMAVQIIVQRVSDEGARTELAIHECEKQIVGQRELLRSEATLTKLLEKEARAMRWTLIQSNVTATAAGTLKVGLSELAKPSFWLKIQSFLS